MAKRIKNAKNAAAIRAGIIQGRFEGLNFEHSGGLMNPFGYIVVAPKVAAVVRYQGEWRHFNFEIFAKAWQQTFDKAFESRFVGLAEQERKIVYDRIIHEAGVRTGRIETVALTLEDGSTATGYRERW